ncbi:MAG: CDP-diacylglycerol--glycerol-3-phosphate 3-phosphatidyltransferase [Sandaracinaceae bacterium]|nr:CDP-diacylglycerol--glycerol-3-phosphate 3-phosphatidyltransferase [Sandaracinaceae bacterium]
MPSDLPHTSVWRSSDEGSRVTAKGGSLASSRLRKSLGEDAFNLPNFLTLLRIALIPVVLSFLYEQTPQSSFWAAMVFTLCSITDFLDGWIARKRGLVSLLGQFLDPMADKVLVVSSLIVMVEINRVPGWAVIVIVARELAVTSFRVIAMSEGVAIPAGQGGKEKAALQMVALVMLMVHYRFDIDFWFFQIEKLDFNGVGLVLLYLSILFAITSAGEYLQSFVRAIEKRKGT